MRSIRPAAWAALLVGLAWAAPASASDSRPALLLRNDVLRTEPRPEAAAAGEARLGEKLRILASEGPWYKVTAKAGEGWVRMFHVKLLPTEVPRAFRTRSAVMGVRGLGAVELERATPDPARLPRLDAWAPSPGELEAFERHGSRRLRRILVSGADAPEETPALEEGMGREAAAGLLGAAPLLEDEEIQRYVNRVGHWVARASDRPGLRWRFGVLKSDSVNAFAAPGGYVFVTAGLYRLLETEAELAGVLAHEIVHVVHGHHLKVMLMGRALDVMKEKTRRMKLSHAAVQAIVRKLAVQGAAVFARALDKETELESDRMAMILVADAGYDPYAYVRVIQLLGRFSPEEDAAALIYKTHPEPASRVEALEALSRDGRIAATGARETLRERFARFSLSGVELKRWPGL